jgi:hypothetical protein
MTMPVIARGPSAKKYLEIRWTYPVYVPPAEVQTDGTHVRAERRALTREEAIRYIAGDDPRPLLVLRECKVCNGTDEALLKGGVDNERTFLMSAWFHCVKLPVDVMDDDHPFRNIFLEKEPEHLFVASADGSNHKPLQSQTSRTELWKSMRDLLAFDYTSKPDQPLKKISSLLDKLDVADQRVREFSERRDELLEKEGPNSKKLPSVARRLAIAQKDLEDLQGEIDRSYALELKRQSDEAAKAAPQPAEGRG